MFRWSRSTVYGIRDGKSIDVDGMKTIKIPYPKIEEQQAIGNYFKSLDNLITLHQRSYNLERKSKTTIGIEEDDNFCQRE